MQLKSTSVKIGSRSYQISSVDDLRFETWLRTKGVSEGDICDIKSFVDYDEQLIMVREKLKQDHKRELVLHELIHACLADVGIETSPDAERFVSVLSPRLIQLVNVGLEAMIDNVVGTANVS